MPKKRISGLLMLIIGLLIIMSGCKDKDTFMLPSENNLASLLTLSGPEISSSQNENLTWKEEGLFSKEELRLVALNLLKNWTLNPPAHATDGTSLYKLSDVFGALVNAIRFYNQNKNLPEQIELVHLIAPGQTFSIDHSIEIKTDDLLKTADTFELLEKNGIPSTLAVGEITLSAAEVFYSLLQTYLFLDSNKPLPDTIYIIPINGF
ncbi:MAG: hypothetical protein WCW30_01275 [Candidatus Gracilibacteria bacterium]